MTTTPKPVIEVDFATSYIRIDSPGASYAITVEGDTLSVRAREGNPLAILPSSTNVVHLAEVRDRAVRKALGL